MKKVYFANALFNQQELDFNKKVVDTLRNTEGIGDKLDIYLPQENEAINDKRGYANSQMIVQGDVEHLEESDILIAVLDGLVVDPGVAAEIGYAYAKGKKIIGLYTDTRQGTFGNQQKIDALDEIGESQFSYINLFVVGMVKERGEMVADSKQLLVVLSEMLEEV